MHEISRLLQSPESKILEFKENLSSLQPILKTIVAFANTAGGTLVIGISSDRKIVGIPDVFLAEEKLANAVADAISPMLLPEIELVSVQNKTLILVKVAHWKGPFYLKKQGIPSGVYIRMGSTSRPAGEEIVEELKRFVINRSYDQQPMTDLTLDSLDLEMIGRVFQKTEKIIQEQTLRSLEVLVPANHGYVPSIGGVILFGKPEVKESYFPNARVRCARFHGKNKAQILDQLEIAGGLLEAIEEVPKFIARNTQLRAVINNIRRKNLPEYPKVAVREILINALVHADYSILGSSIQVAIYQDRLEIQNPGMLPFGFTIEDLRAGISRVRNRVMAKIFHKLGLMEEWGSGYRRVMEVCQEEGYPYPDWKEYGTTMRVTLYSQDTATRTSKIGKSEDLLTEREKSILALFKNGVKLPFREIYSHFREEVSERTIRYELTKLREKQYLASRGSGPKVTWEKVERYE